MRPSSKRALSLRQAQRCENALQPKCKCRCGGKAHGKARLAADAKRSEYEALPLEDPHNPIRKKERRKREMVAAIRAQNLELFTA